MWKDDKIPPALIEALMALTDGENVPEGAVLYCIRPDPREQLVDAFQEGLDQGHRFFDVLGGRLDSPDQVIEALKADGRVQVTQTVELDPELAPYL